MADLVIWDPKFFGAKPEMILKNGMAVSSLMGDPNATIPTPQPMVYRRMFGAYGKGLTNSSITFVSQSSYDDNIKEKLGDRKSTRLNSSHVAISYAVFCLKKKTH